jgi:hypothetical protein
MKENWEAETSVENGEAVDPLLIRWSTAALFEETCEKEGDLDDWPVTIE